MPTFGLCGYSENRSEFYRSLQKHFENKGIVSQYKIDCLMTKWVRRKGYRLPA